MHYTRRNANRGAALVIIGGGASLELYYWPPFAVAFTCFTDLIRTRQVLPTLRANFECGCTPVTLLETVLAS